MKVLWLVFDLILITLLIFYYVFIWPNRWRWNRDISRIINKKRKRKKTKISLDYHLKNKIVRTTIFKSLDDRKYFCDIKYEKGNSKLRVQELEITVLKYPEQLFEQQKKDYFLNNTGKALISVKRDSKYYNQCDIEIDLVDRKYK